MEGLCLAPFSHTNINFTIEVKKGEVDAMKVY
jgi:hypothetical protein